VIIVIVLEIGGSRCQALRKSLITDETTGSGWRRHWTAGGGLDALETLLARRQAAMPSRFCVGDTPGLADVFLFGGRPPAGNFG
jgi:maleylpyruvate isomerase